MRRLRAAYRLLCTAWHVLGGALTVALIFPFCDDAKRNRLKQRWSARLLGRLGVELRSTGIAPAGGLIVANHISFLDIYVIHTLMPASFISKDEIRKWPLIGWLAASTGTLFMERGSRGAAQRTREITAEQLRQGGRVALFPEGTTSAGDTVLPFHSALLQAAIDAGANVIPVALRYTDRQGKRSSAAAYIDEMSLLRCLWNIAGSPRIIAHADILPPLASDGVDRRHLSTHAHRVISHHISHLPMRGMDARPSQRTAQHLTSV